MGGGGIKRGGKEGQGETTREVHSSFVVHSRAVAITCMSRVYLPCARAWCVCKVFTPHYSAPHRLCFTLAAVGAHTSRTRPVKSGKRGDGW